MEISRFIRTAIIILTFLIAFYGRTIVYAFFEISPSSVLLRIVHFYSWWVVPTILATGFLFGFRNILNELGLSRGILSGIAFSAITVLPMFLGSAIIGKPGGDLNFGSLMHSTFVAGFMEEYLFRGFLFGLLFRRSGWGFIPASVLGALFFGLGHIYQGSNLVETFAIFIITAIGAAWFAWLYIEWNDNLWVPVFLHIFMNLSWGLFDVSSNALGNVYANVFRIITIALTIIITICYNKKHGLRINKKNLVLNKTSG